MGKPIRTTARVLEANSSESTKPDILKEPNGIIYAAAAAAAEKNKIKYPVLRNSFWPLTQASEFSPCKSNIGRVQRERVQYYIHTPKYRTCHLILWEGKSPENKDAIYIYIYI